jgi:dTDP-4-dehydrorhamnose 3,5-epimerase
MKYLECEIPGVILLEPDLLEDERGFFTRLFCQEELAGRGVDFPVAQVNLSGNHRRGTLRGLHFQKGPEAEDKLVRAVTGAIFDVAVDLRPDSPTFSRWAGFELSADNRRSLLIPKGCAHGYLTLADNTETLYLTSSPYRPGAEGGLRWNDPFCRVDWPFEPLVISSKDQAWPPYVPNAGATHV